MIRQGMGGLKLFRGNLTNKEIFAMLDKISVAKKVNSLQSSSNMAVI